MNCKKKTINNIRTQIKFKNNELRNRVHRFYYQPKKSICIRSALRNESKIIIGNPTNSEDEAKIYSLSKSLIGSASIGVKPSFNNNSISTMDINEEHFNPKITSTPKKKKNLNNKKIKNKISLCNDELFDYNQTIILKNFNKDLSNEKSLINFDFSSDIKENINELNMSSLSLIQDLKNIERRLFDSGENNDISNLSQGLELEMLKMDISKDNDLLTDFNNEIMFKPSAEYSVKVAENIPGISDAINCSSFECSYNKLTSDNLNLCWHKNMNCSTFDERNKLNNQDFGDLKIGSSINCDTNIDNIPENIQQSYLSIGTLGPLFDLQIFDKNSLINNDEELNFNLKPKMESNKIFPNRKLSVIEDSVIDGFDTFENVLNMKTISAKDQVAEWLTEKVKTPFASPKYEQELNGQQCCKECMWRNYKINEDKKIFNQNFDCKFSVNNASEQQISSSTSGFGDDSLCKKNKKYSINKRSKKNFKKLYAGYKKEIYLKYFTQGQNNCPNINRNNKLNLISQPTLNSAENNGNTLCMPKAYFNEPKIKIKNVNLY